MPRKLSSYRLLTDAEEAGNTREYGDTWNTGKYGDTCTFPLLVVGGSTVTEYGESVTHAPFPFGGVR